MRAVLASDRAGVIHLTRGHDIWPLCQMQDTYKRRQGWEPADLDFALSRWDRHLVDSADLTCLFCIGGHHAK